MTAGNASGINDAAAAVVLMERRRAEPRGLKPMARLVAYAHAGVDPKIMGIGPVPARASALEKAGLKVADIDVIEANEAFAAQACAVSKELGLDPAQGQPERRRHLARPPDRRDRRDHHGQGALRAAAHRRALRAGHDVHRRRAGHRGDLRADVAPFTPALSRQRERGKESPLPLGLGCEEQTKGWVRAATRVYRAKRITKAIAYVLMAGLDPAIRGDTKIGANRRVHGGNAHTLRIHNYILIASCNQSSSRPK